MTHLFLNFTERPGTSSAVGQETDKVPPPALEDVDNPFSNQFWDKLQESWSKIDQEQSWLSDFNDYTDPFKVTFVLQLIDC